MNAIAPPRATLVDQIFGANKAPIDEVLAADFADLKAEAKVLLIDAQNLPAVIREERDQIAAGVYVAKVRGFLKKADEARSTEKKPLLDASRALDGFFGEIGADVKAVAGQMQRAMDGYAREVAAAERARAEREAQEARAKAETERAKAEVAKSAGAAANAEARAESLDAKADALEDRAAASTVDLTRTRGSGVTISGKEVWTATITDYVAAISPLGAIGPYFKRDALEAALISMVRIQKDAAAWPGVQFHADVRTSVRR